MTFNELFHNTIIHPMFALLVLLHLSEAGQWLHNGCSVPEGGYVSGLRTKDFILHSMVAHPLCVFNDKFHRLWLPEGN